VLQVKCIAISDGETEARNTQARLTLGAEARRNTPPRMTEDVARDKQIVRFDGGRAEMAIREVDGFVEIDGSTDIAYLDLKGYRESAPIRLEVGDESFGLEHIKAHEDQILNAGFDSVEQFIRHVANNFTEVRKGNHGRLILDIPNKNTGDMMTVMLKMSDDGGFWSVSNAAIVRMKYLEKFEKLPVVSGDGSRNASGKRQGLSQSSEYQTTIGADNALPTGNSDITTPKSEVNTLKQELAKSKDAQRLMNSGKVEVVQSIDDLPIELSEQVKRSVAGGAESVQDFANRIAEKYSLERFDLWESVGLLKLVNLVVKQDSRGKGVGSSVMNELVDYAESRGMMIVLSPAVSGDGMGTTSRSRLVKFYKRFGFTENKGRNRDFEISDGMYRGVSVKYSENGQVQGLFDHASNKTYLIADNLSTADAMGVLTHEVGVHAWFASANSEKKAAIEKRAVSLLKTRELASGGLREFLDSVQQRMVDAEQVNDNGTYKDNEEAVAYIVEEAINKFADSRYLLNDNKLLDAIGKVSKSLANFIADVITYLKSSMHKLGWMDTQKLTAGDLVAIAKGNMREVAQNDVGVNDGMLAGDVADYDGAAKYSKQGNQSKPDLIAPKFELKDKAIATKIDRFHRLKQLQDMVQEKTGDKSVAVYDAAMRYFAIAPSKLLDMQRSVERSLKAMIKDGIDRHTLANYMYAVHAPERNAYIKAKNGTENGSGMTDQQAKDIADGLLSLHPTLKKHAAEWRKMLDETMQDRIRNGTVSQKQADEWKSAMPNYVPLKNAVDDTDAFEFETGIVTQKALFGTGQRFNLKGKEFKEALGRKSLAGDIVEHMVFDMQRGIVRGQKNVAMIEFARTVARHVDAVGADGKKLWKVLQTHPDSDMGKVIEFMLDGRKNYIQVFDEPTLAALKGLNEDGFTAWNPAFTIVNSVRDGEAAVINATQELGLDGAAKMMGYVGGGASENWEGIVAGGEFASSFDKGATRAGSNGSSGVAGFTDGNG
jgi:GNAT superfamily N-acetyltransferase